MDDEVGARGRIVLHAHFKQIAVPTGSDERDAAVVLRNCPSDVSISMQDVLCRGAVSVR